MSPGDDPRTAALSADLEAAKASMLDFAEALYGVNDPDLRDAFAPPLSLGDVVLDGRRRGTLSFVADEVATLRSGFARHPVRREDPVLGPSDSLRRLRSARGALLADLDAVLASAAELGLTPTALSFEPPSRLDFERAGLEGMMTGMERRLGEVERALKAIEPEGAEADGHSLQQIGLVNFYVGTMSVEVALARLEATAKAIIDFNSLGRAVEVMADLTRDFVASVRGMSGRVTDTLAASTRKLPKLVGRVVGGLRAIAGRVGRSKAGRVPLEEPPSAGTLLSVADSARARFWALVDQGDAAGAAGATAAAVGAYEAAYALAEQQREADRDDPMWRRNGAVAYNRLGDAALGHGDLSVADRYYRASFDTINDLAATSAGAEWQSDIAVGLQKLGDLAETMGRFMEARDRYEAALAICKRLVADDPDDAAGHAAVALVHGRLGRIAEHAQLWTEAEAQGMAGLTILRNIVARNPAGPEGQRDLMIMLNLLGDVAAQTGKLGKAREYYEESLLICERLAAESPNNIELQRDRGIGLNKLGSVARDAKDFAQARRLYDASLVIRENIALLDADNAFWQRDLAVMHTLLGDVAQETGDPAEAQRHYEADLRITQALVARQPDNATWQRDLFVTHTNLGLQARIDGDMASALRHYETAARIAEALVELRSDHPRFSDDLERTRAILDKLRDI